MRSAPKSARPAEAGFVLVAVLWILAALATLASIYSSYTIKTAAASRVADDRVQAEESIRAGIEMAVFHQLELPEKARPARGGFNTRVGRTNLSVRFRSEGAKVDLNGAPAELLAGLFSAVGVDPARADTFAERVIGWRTKAATGGEAGATAADSGTDKAAEEDEFYREQHVPYPPRHGPFDNALELSLLPGISLAVVERILPFVTVFSGRPDIDVSTADPTVLSALPEMTPQILGAVLDARVKNPNDANMLMALLGPAKTHATTERSKALRASIAVDFDNGRRVHAEVVFRLKDEGLADKPPPVQAPDDRSPKDEGSMSQHATNVEPYDLLYWRDDFDGPMQSA
jgi:general secretion pathway protein K